MFKSTGKQLKIVAVILFWLNTIASVICAFVFGDLGDFDSDAAVFFAFLIGGPVVAYIWSLILYGFGYIVSANDWRDY